MNANGTTTNPEGSETRRSVVRRLAATLLSARGVGAVAVGIAASFNPAYWRQAAVACALVWALSAGAAAWLACALVTDPLGTLRAAFGGMIIHFGSVVGGGLILVLAFGFQPVAVLLPALATALVCVFGNAWLAQIPVHSTSTDSARPRGAVAAATDSNRGSGGGNGSSDPRIVEARP